MSANIIQGCFHDTTESTLFSKLILLYVGEETQLAKKERSVFNRFFLQENYRARHQQEPLKLKPLRVVYIRTPRDRRFLLKILSLWDKIILKQLDRLKKTSAFETVSQKYFFWFLYSSHIGQALAEIESPSQKALIVNEQNITEGVSYSTPDPACSSARYIECMLTAPWNHINEYRSVKGVGSALIELAAWQSLKQQNIHPDDELSVALLKKAIVTLNTTSISCSIYTHLFFVEVPNSDGNMILSGENVLNFFERFGGRAQCKHISISP